MACNNWLCVNGSGIATAIKSWLECFCCCFTCFCCTGILFEFSFDDKIILLLFLAPLDGETNIVGSNKAGFTGVVTDGAEISDFFNNWWSGFCLDSISDKSVAFIGLHVRTFDRFDEFKNVASGDDPNSWPTNLKYFGFSPVNF